MVVTAVEETATSAGTRGEKNNGRWRRRHNRTLNACGSIRVDRNVGKAMNALHVCCLFCDRQSARSGLVNVGPNRPCHFVFVCGLCCRFLPTMFWLGVPQNVLTLQNRCGTRAIVEHEVADHHFCHIGVPFLHTGKPRHALQLNTVPPLPSARGRCPASTF